MKILNKIIKDYKEPKSKEVLWVDTKTNETKVYGSNGWEAVKTGNSGNSENVEQILNTEV